MTRTSPCDDRPLLTPAAAAARLGITRRALAALRRRGIGPRYIRLSTATIRYLRDDLESTGDMDQRTEAGGAATPACRARTDSRRSGLR